MLFDYLHFIPIFIHPASLNLIFVNLLMRILNEFAGANIHLSLLGMLHIFLSLKISVREFFKRAIQATMMTKGMTAFFCLFVAYFNFI